MTDIEEHTTVIDLDKIKPGDEVKIEFRGLSGWQTVAFVNTAADLIRLDPSGWCVGARHHSDIRVIEHKPAPVKIEVELPEPGKRHFDSMIVSRSLSPAWAVTISVQREVTAQSWSADVAEEFALAILALVHEARS